jgi:diguanylate cyclase (GGDEF)-like protein
VQFQNGKPVATRGIFRDITERKKAEEAVAHLAYHDALTDLPNRNLLRERLDRALAQACRDEQTLTVIFLDLDRFKLVNDTAGHAEGDRLLQSVADELRSLAREGDTVGRVGGDEFILLIQGIAGAEDAAAVAERILESFRRLRVLGGHEFHITASLGVTMYPGGGEDSETLLRNADIAMYQAKQAGRDNCQFYNPAMNTQIEERLVLESDLRHALERGEFTVNYQPQVDVNTRQVVGVEALVRWQHPERGLVLPGEFIPVAEETGLIVPLGEWVLRTACTQNKAWQEAGFPPMRMAVNLSARQFQEPNLVDAVAQVLRESGLDPHYLQLEITEGTAIQDVDFTITMLRILREMGVEIAIDDFGTGYSSLAYLQRFAIDVIKLDRSFMRDIPIKTSDAAIATTVIMMAHNLKLSVIAEGVETEEQLAFLKEQGCDEFQGYLFSKPLPPTHLEKLIKRGKRLPVVAR